MEITAGKNTFVIKSVKTRSGRQVSQGEGTFTRIGAAPSGKFKAKWPGMSWQNFPKESDFERKGKDLIESGQHDWTKQ